MNKITTLTILFAFSLFKCYAQEDKLIDTIAICSDNSAPSISQINFRDPKSKFKKLVVGAYEVTPNKDYECYKYTGKNIPIQALRFSNIEIHRTSDHSLLWSKKGECTYKPTKYGVLEISWNRISLLDYENGKKIWTQNLVKYAGVINDRVFVRNDRDVIQSYKLENGKRSWGALIEYQNNGLRYSQYVDSTHDYLFADNIYKIDWTNGHTKVLQSTNTISDPSSILLGLAKIGMIASSFAIGASTGYYTFVIPYNRGIRVEGNHELYLPAGSDRIMSLHSGIVSDNGKNYYADYNQITCFNDDMEPIWAKELPKKKASKSELCLDGENIYMINLGYGISRGNSKAVGRPFVAGFKKSNGSELFYKELSEDKKAIYGYHIFSDKKIICLLFDDAITNVSTDTYEINTVNYDKNNIGTLQKFVKEGNYYVNKDKKFILLKNLTKKKAVYSSKSKILDLSVETGETSPICELNDIYIVAKKEGNKMLLIGGDEQEELWYVNGDKANMLTSEMGFYYISNNTVTFKTKSHEMKSFHFE